MDDIHKSGILTGIQNLLTSSEYSDLIIRSGSEEFKVHRAIICPRSQFFAAACKGPFQEGKTGIITLHNDDTPTVHRMLNYLYTLDYDDEGEPASVANYGHGLGASGNRYAATVVEEEELPGYDLRGYPQILNNIAVYAIADKYDIPELEALAATKFTAALWDSMLESDMASLRAIIDVVFNITSDAKCELRDATISYCNYWKKAIIDDDNSVAIVKDYGEIGLAMVRGLFHEREEDEASTEARIQEVMARENTLIWHIERISRAAKCMKVPESREVQQNYIDAQRRRLRDLRETIQAAKEFIKPDNE